MANVDSLDALLQEELKDLYDAEKQLTKALPKLAKKATAPELKQAMQEHLQQTEQHVERLEQVFDLLDLPARGKRCEGMKHLLSEGEEMIGEADDDATRDAVMIASAQKVEHYEIAAYGTLRTWAGRLGRSEVASILEETLDEEKETDERLTRIAEDMVNERAAASDDEEEAPARRGGARRSASASGSRGAGQHAAMDRGTRGGAAATRRRPSGGASRGRR